MFTGTGQVIMGRGRHLSLSLVRGDVTGVPHGERLTGGWNPAVLVFCTCTHIKSVLIGGGVDAEGASNCLLPSYWNRYLIHHANGSSCTPQIFRAQQPTLQKNIQFQLASHALATVRKTLSILSFISLCFIILNQFRTYVEMSVISSWVECF